MRDAGNLDIVVPAKAKDPGASFERRWAPAFAGTTGVLRRLSLISVITNK